MNASMSVCTGMNLLFRRIDKYGKKTPIQSGFVESIESWFCRCKHCFYRSLSSPHWIMHSCGRVTYNLSLTAFVVIGYASLLYAWHALIGCTRTGIHFANGKVYWSQKSSIWTGTHSANNGRRVSQLNQMKTTAHLFQNHMVRYIDFGRRTKTECCLCFDSFFAWSATTTSMKGWVIDSHICTWSFATHVLLSLSTMTRAQSGYFLVCPSFCFAPPHNTASNAE